MIGNDIVDLKLASTQSNWQRNGFLDKLFTSQEQDFILNSSEPFKAVWLLWSIKESAYKAYIHLNGGQFFSPKKIACSPISKNKASVLINKQLFFAESEINEDFIHTIAFPEKYDNWVLNKCFKFNDHSFETQHLETYQNVLRAFSDKLNIPISRLSIKKNTDGVPQLFQNKTPLKNAFSLTHHGNFGAFCIAN